MFNCSICIFLSRICFCFRKVIFSHFFFYWFYFLDRFLLYMSRHFNQSFIFRRLFYEFKWKVTVRWLFHINQHAFFIAVINDNATFPCSDFCFCQNCYVPEDNNNIIIRSWFLFGDDIAIAFLQSSNCATHSERVNCLEFFLLKSEDSFLWMSS